MHRQFIALVVIVLAGIFTLVGGHAAYADTVSNETATENSQPHIITVNKGDYLDKLASENNTTYLRLYYANDEIKDPNLIYPGEQLRVPDSSETLAPRPLSENVAVPVQAATDSVVTPDSSPRATTPQPAAPAPTPAATIPADTSIWDQLAACESGGNWAINTGNGFYGGLQFTVSSWHAVGGSGLPSQASRSEQIYRGQLLQARQGWGAWPACSAKLGLR